MQTVLLCTTINLMEGVLRGIYLIIALTWEYSLGRGYQYFELMDVRLESDQQLLWMFHLSINGSPQ